MWSLLMKFCKAIIEAIQRMKRHTNTNTNTQGMPAANRGGWDWSWASLLLLAVAWASALHIYEPVSLLCLFCALAAVVCSYAGQRKRGKLNRLAAMKNAGKFILLAALAQGAVLPFYYIWAARVHSEVFFAAIASALLNLFGVTTVREGSMLYIDTPLNTIVFLSNWEKVGALFFLLLAVGGIVLLLLKKARAKHFAYFLSSLLAYAAVRYTFLIMIYTAYPFHSLFWERAATFVTLAPVALLWAVVFKGLPLPAPVISFKGLARRQTLCTGALAFLLVFAGASFFGFRDVGQEKQGRVLVDEYHSDWEWTTDAYDEQWFGERSGYNYYCFFNYLDKFYQTQRNAEAIRADALQDVDVFIIKTPTKPFTDEEVQVISDFVVGGGGLYLIGDHTNVFGTGVNLNQIASEFGLRFNYDCTYELVNGNLSEYDAPKLLPHPVISTLPHFLFATSDTLQAKWQAEEVITGYGLKNLPADYSQKNFFPADTNAPLLEFGLFLQSAAVSQGRGRVLAFTDSTVFSNFWMFMPGKPELLLGSISWLNRENRFTGVVPREIAAVFLALMIIANGLWAWKNRKSFPTAVFLTAGAAALIFGCGMYHFLGKAAAPLPEPVKPMVWVNFERQYSRFELPDNLAGFLTNMDEQLNTFYVWTQRIDYFPRVEGDLLEALRAGELTVMAKPGKEIKNPQQVIDAVSAGAKLLILDNLACGGYANRLLALTDMRIIQADMAEDAAYEELTDVPLTVNASAIAGGEALMIDGEGNAVFAVQKIGDGLIAVFSDPDLFYSYELGDVSANLTEKTRLLTELEFKVLRSLELEGDTLAIPAR
jgi:hypothetical protein